MLVIIYIIESIKSATSPQLRNLALFSKLSMNYLMITMQFQRLKTMLQKVDNNIQLSKESMKYLIYHIIRDVTFCKSSIPIYNTRQALG